DNLVSKPYQIRIIKACAWKQSTQIGNLSQQKNQIFGRQLLRIESIKNSTHKGMEFLGMGKKLIV
ncbi:MAG: hypothetical protein ACYTXY_49165, partial [Nostoc sp.]